MPEQYRIKLGIDNSQADAAARASTKAMQAYERQCLAAARAAQAAVHSAGGQATGPAAGGMEKTFDRVTAAARKTAQAVQFLTQPHSGSGLKTVIADLDKLHASLAKDKGFYVGAGGTGAAKPGAYANVSSFLEKARRERIAVEQPRVGLSAGGEAYVDDGRHRLARLKELGVRRFPVSVPAEEAAAFAARFGASGSGRAPRTATAAMGGGEPKIDVGYYKAVIDGIKLQDKKVAAAEKAAAQITAIEDRFYIKDYQAKVKAERKKEQIDDLARSRTEKAIKDLDGLEESYRVKDYQKRVAYEKRKEALEGGPAANAAKYRRRELTETEAHAVALNRIQDVQNKRRIEGIAKGMGEQRLSFAEAINSALGLEGAFTKVAIAGAAIGGGLGAIKAVLGSVVDGYEKIHQEAVKAAEATLAMRDNLRMEAVLMGAPTADTASLQKALALRAATGLGEQEASDLTRQFYGSLPVGLQKGNITPQVAHDLLTQVGVTQARAGGDAGTRGDIAGILGQFGKVGSVEQGLGQLESIRQGLTAGRGDDPILTRQLLKVAGSIVKEGGTVGSLSELAAVIGVTSLSAGPEEAATRAEQLNRGLRSGQTKHMKGKGAISSQADYLKSLGIGEKDTLESSLAKIVPDIRKAQEAGRAPDVYLAERGFRSSEERRALIETVENYDVLKIRLEQARKASSGADEVAKNKAYLASPAGRLKVATQAGAAETAAKGLMGERFVAATAEARESPETRRADESILTTVVGDTVRGIMVGQLPFIGKTGTMEAGREERVRALALTNLRKKAQAAKVPDVQLENLRRKSYGTPNPEAEYTRLVEEEIERRGGNLAVNPAASLNNLGRAAAVTDPNIAAELKRIADAAEKTAKSNEAMEKRDAARNVAPPAQPVAGPAPLAGR